MTDIGILNFHFSNNNYGAVLQAAALQNAVKELGYTVENIDYLPLEISIKNKIKGQIYYLLQVFGLREKYISPPKATNEIIFEEFRQKWIKTTKQQFDKSKDLYVLESKYKAVIVGSDQVWRPMFYGGESLVYFLNFLSGNTKRISYASSFGVDRWEYISNKKYTKSVKEELSKFSAISVREDSGIAICNNLFNVDATHVLDPTLLVGHDFFNKIINSGKYNTIKKESSGIVFYKLDVSEDFLSAIKHLSDELNCDLTNIYRESRNDGIYYRAVDEWLYLLKNSSVVITDSFHCVCFSILFNKPFVYLGNNARGMTRIESLLGSLDLMDRICLDVKLLKNYINKDTIINYSEVNQRLIKMRSESLKFIKNALKN
ncbi:polysaccharide pyruvyl transferase family protein [Photobacterium iliopiscarium]|uniref:Polysaccharide pyruvyl transferase domain-containing protein n=1 Tax=Photobacterium iliopiscarium TaxID=56192 RepID=A0A2T3MNU5_9GAMM|nr:polysaccharide pyruvyl transferase family protein [Photobacterium iliopiscarium]PSV98600.1 hypothetical protein C9I88_03995 [Photobacterium iliopiscarium]